MNTAPALAPGIPADYYRRIFEAEADHWWYVGMRELSATMLGSRIGESGVRLLDAGCGTGGFLRWVLDRGAWTAVAGADLASAALELARGRVPEADLRAGPLSALPFDNGSFDVVVSNDVLQHVPEAEVGPSLLELHRVLRPAGTLVLRTNGSRRLRRERVDWRAYDSRTLRAQLDEAGFEVDRVTYANCVLSVWGSLRGRVPHAPSEDADGIPTRPPGAFVSAVGRRVLAAEARYLARPGRTLPFGHSLIAVVHRPA